MRISRLERSGRSKRFRGYHGLECLCGTEVPALEKCPNCGQLVAVCEVSPLYFIGPTPGALGDEQWFDDVGALLEATCPSCAAVQLKDFAAVLEADVDVAGWQPGDYC